MIQIKYKNITLEVNSADEASQLVHKLFWRDFHGETKAVVSKDNITGVICRRCKEVIVGAKSKGRKWCSVCKVKETRKNQRNWARKHYALKKEVEVPAEYLNKPVGLIEA